MEMETGSAGKKSLQSRAESTSRNPRGTKGYLGAKFMQKKFKGLSPRWRK